MLEKKIFTTVKQWKRYYRIKLALWVAGHVKLTKDAKACIKWNIIETKHTNKQIISYIEGFH